MNISQIRYFVSVAHTGSFSAAARKNCVTVQAVSKAISNLEASMGEPLFCRENEGVTLTKVGQGFLAHAEEALKEVENLDALIQQPSEILQPTGDLRLHLAAPEFPQSELMCRNLENLARALLKVPVHINHGSMNAGMDALYMGKVDALLTVGEVVNPNFDCTSLGKVPTGINVLRSHPLAGAQCATREDLEKYPVLFSSDLDSMNESVLTLYRKSGVNLRLKPLDTMEQFVRYMEEKNAYIFTAIMPSMASSAGDHVYVPIAKKEAISVPLCMVSMKSRKSAGYLVLEEFLAHSPATKVKGMIQAAQALGSKNAKDAKSVKGAKDAPQMGGVSNRLSTVKNALLG